MRADGCALVALDAVFDLPFRYHDGNAALFIFCSARRERAVGLVHELTDGKGVAFLLVHGHHDLIDKGVARLRIEFFVRAVLPGFGHRDLHEVLDASFDSASVHVDHILALLAVGMFNGFLEVGDSVVDRNDISQFEEGCLHDHVDAAAKTNLAGNLHGVDGVEVDFLFGNDAFELARQTRIEFFPAPAAVEEERAAFLDAV